MFAKLFVAPKVQHFVTTIRPIIRIRNFAVDTTVKGSVTSDEKKKHSQKPDDCRPKDIIKKEKSGEAKEAIKICLCGSTTEIGRPLSLFLKLSECVSELNLFDTSDNCCALGIELAYMNLKCRIKSFCSPDLLKKALENSNIVVITSPSPFPPSGSAPNAQMSDDEFKANAKVVKDIVEASADACPNAIIAIISNPVSSMVPLACEVMKKRSKTDNLKKILGITALNCLRCQSMVSSMLNVPFDSVAVPVVGGTTAETLVPLLSQAKPPHPFTKEEVSSLTDGLRAAVTEISKAGGIPTITTAYAASSFIETICRAIKGETGIKQCAFVHTPHWLALGYLSCPLLLSKDGIEEILYPPINEFEQCLLNKAEKELKEDIKRGMDFIRCDPKGAAEVMEMD